MDRYRRAAVVRSALRNRQLLRMLVAFLLFNVAWWAYWIAVLVWAYDRDGVRGASVLALAQLVPAAILASPAARLMGRWPTARALTLGYVVQTVAYLVLGAALAFDAPLGVVVPSAMFAAVAITLTRPVHNALLPDISDTTGELTAGYAASGTLEAMAIVVGPLACGLTIELWGPGGVVLVMAACTAVAVMATVGLVANQAPAAAVCAGPRSTSHVHEVVRDPASRLLTGLVAAESTMVGMIDILVLALALDLLGMSDGGPGLLNAAVGLGGLLGAAFTFVLVGRQRLGLALLLAGVAAGLPFALAGVAPGVGAVLVLLILCGAGKAFFEVTARTFLQRLLPDHLLTAVFGLQESMLMAGYALGSLAAPLLVAGLGVQGAFLVAGLFLPVVTIASWSAVRRLDAKVVVPPDVLALLLNVPILRVLAPRIVERLAREAVPVAAPIGSRLVSEGEPGDRFYVIASGDVSVSRGATPLRRLGPGGWFGELALLRDVPRTASVDVVSDAELWALERDSFLAAVAPNPRSVQAIDDHARDQYE